MIDRYAFVYSSSLDAYSYGSEHPFHIHRYRLTHDLIHELGWFSPPNVVRVDAPPAPDQAVRAFHRADYLAILKEFSADATPRANFRYGLGDVENPVFQGMYDWALLGCGATLEAVRQVMDGGCRAAFSIVGGFHHAHAARASGFSYLNDAVVAILGEVARGRRVAYVDIDAHHGDGVQEAFYESDQVLTISLHETGADFFPHTGFTHELGRGKGYGYAINVPFVPHADDLIFEQAFTRVVEPLLKAFQPDLLVTQMGVDTLRTDPLTRLEMTTGGIEFAARSFRDLNLPWVALGGGGYDRINVARAWSLVWATMISAAVPEGLPPEFRRTAADFGSPVHRLRDAPRLAQPDDFARAQRSLDRSLAVLERRVFPLYGISAKGGA